MVETIPYADAELGSSINFAFETARGVNIPGVGEIRLDQLEGAFTVPWPQSRTEPGDAVAGHLCHLFIGQAPFKRIHDIGGLLESAVGCEVYALCPLPNPKRPKQPPTSCSITVRKEDAWAFLALDGRCIVTTAGLLVVPEDARDAFHALLRRRDDELQKLYNNARKGGQPLSVEQRRKHRRDASTRQNVEQKEHASKDNVTEGDKLESAHENVVEDKPKEPKVRGKAWE